jgi:hypothetical protein
MPGFFLTAASLWAAAAGSAMGDCAPIPGWDEVLAREEVRWIVIGEMHGTAEIPQAFADAVCLTARERPVVVALEQPAFDQPLIDAWLVSDGGEAARRAFLAAQMWQGSMKDGRSSQATFELFDRLRHMHQAGQVRAVVAFVRPLVGSFTQAGHEEAMARGVAEAAVDGATVVALTGDGHARLGAVPWGDRYRAMASHLPPEQTVSLVAAGNGGEAWVCTGQPIECKAQPAYRPAQHERGVVLGGHDEGSYSGTLRLGVATTASPPQGS